MNSTIGSKERLHNIYLGKIKYLNRQFDRKSENHGNVSRGRDRRFPFGVGASETP